MRPASVGCGLVALAVLGAGCGGPVTPGGRATTPAAGDANATAPVGAGTPGGPPVSPPPAATLATRPRDFFPATLVTDARGSFGLDRARILPSDDARFSRVLQVSYPAGSVNPSSTHKDGVTYGGVQLFLPLRKRPAKSLHLRYYVRFPAGFDFARGGKLPGLFGVVDKDRRIVRTESGGFSTRYLWRRRGAGGVYAYLPGTVHGARTPGVRTLGKGKWLWAPGQWICVEQSVRLNVPGRADGYVKVYVDGTQVLAAKGLTLRSTESVRVGGVFSTFFGGGDRSFAPPRDQTVDFAGVAVSPTYIGPLPKK